MGMVSLAACLGPFSLRDVEGSQEERLARVALWVIGIILGQTIVSSSENTRFCGVNGGGSSSFESVLCR